jgi:hypothetical protein
MSLVVISSSKCTRQIKNKNYSKIITKQIVHLHVCTTVFDVINSALLILTLLKRIDIVYGGGGERDFHLFVFAKNLLIIALTG